MIALITGASRGIGAATAKLLAKNGYTICLNYLSDDVAAESVKSEIIQLGGRCILVKGDASTEKDVKTIFETIDDQLGSIRLLVNNVGILKKQSRLVDMDLARFSQVLNTNVLSYFLCSKEAVKRMSTLSGGSGGCIINISSGAAQSGSPHEYIDYAASKGAIDSLTRGLALEVCNQGIRVNGVRPGFIDTNIHADGGEPNRVARLAPIIPLRRAGTPEEVAQVICWLAAESSSYVTGKFIDVTGGV